MTDPHAYPPPPPPDPDDDETVYSSAPPPFAGPRRAAAARGRAGRPAVRHLRRTLRHGGPRPPPRSPVRRVHRHRRRPAVPVGRARLRQDHVPRRAAVRRQPVRAPRGVGQPHPGQQPGAQGSPELPAHAHRRAHVPDGHRGHLAPVLGLHRHRETPRPAAPRPRPAARRSCWRSPMPPAARTTTRTRTARTRRSPTSSTAAASSCCSTPSANSNSATRSGTSAA
ncbi:hypothetical protein ACU686_41320 [Yinghuangia aomiensis]